MESSDAVSLSGYAVQVEIPRPDKTSRLLLLVRFILIIPQLVFGLAVVIVAAVLLVINYFVVLITGRAAFIGYLSGTVRYSTRVGVDHHVDRVLHRADLRPLPAGAVRARRVVDALPGPRQRVPVPGRQRLPTVLAELSSR